jgi:hypothetical protein
MNTKSVTLIFRSLQTTPLIFLPATPSASMIVAIGTVTVDTVITALIIVAGISRALS